MDNNGNNNTDNNVNIGMVQPNVENAQVSTAPASVEVVQPVASPATNIVNVDTSNVGVNVTDHLSTTTNATQPVVNATTPNVATNTVVNPNVEKSGNNNENSQEKYYKKFFVMMGIIVAGVLLISGILLYFLLNGSIENRNRLTCTKNVQGEGYEEHVKRYYTFDGGVMKRVYFTHTFTYDELTDDMYNETYDEIINNDNHFISKYGLGTSITREENVVTITAYDINYFQDEVKDIKNKNDKEGFTCE